MPCPPFLAWVCVMKRFFCGRWLSMLGLAVVLFALAGFAYQTWADEEAAKAQARDVGMPEPVSLATFQAWSDLHPAGEVHVIARIFPELNYRLEMTHKRKLSSTVEERTLMFLFGPEDPAGTRVVRGALMLDKQDVDRWTEQEATAGYVASDADSLTLRLNGNVDASPNLDSMAEDAIIARGLTKAPEFFYLESWGPRGRDAALAPDPKTGPQVAAGLAGLGFVFLLVGLRRFARRHRLIAQQEALAQQMEAARAAMAAKYTAQGLAVPETLAQPLTPRKSRAKAWGVGLAVTVAAIFGLAKIGILDDALFAIPVLMVLLIILGMRQVAKVIGRGARRVGDRVAQKVMPVLSEPAVPPIAVPSAPPRPVRTGPRRLSEMSTPGSGAIQSIPSVRARLSGALSAPGLVKWAPFGIGVVVMVASSRLFGTLDLSGQKGADPATAAPDPAPGADLPFGGVDFVNLPDAGMVLTTLGVVGGMALLGIGLNLLVSRFARRRGIAYPNDPWARLDRMAAVERARG